MYTAKAILKDIKGDKWEVVIYNRYESITAAIKGVERFSSHNYNIDSVIIAENK